MRKSPFFGTILFNLPVEFNKEVPTLGVDGFKLSVNKKFWHSFDKKPEAQIALLMHEVGHLFLMHPYRGRKFPVMATDPSTGQTISLYNLAGDAVINLLLTDEGFKLPDGAFIDQKYRGMTTEEVYLDLLKQVNKNGKASPQIQQMAGKSMCDKDGWKNAGAKPDQKGGEKHWERVVGQAVENAKRAGKLPAFAERLWEDMQPKEDWRNILRTLAQPFNNDYSFTPSDRRYLDQDFSLPDINDGQQIDWIAVAFDTSGSISQKELSSMVGELRGVLESYDRVKVKLTHCDTEATPFVELDEFNADKVKPEGGGGTDFKPVFKLINKEPSRPLIALYFTDMEGSFPKTQPDYPVIWINTQGRNAEAPFGEVLPYKV